MDNEPDRTPTMQSEHPKYFGPKILENGAGIQEVATSRFNESSNSSFVADIGAHKQIKRWLFSTLFILHFFLPYIYDTRLRFDVVFAYFGIILFTVMLFKKTVLTNFEYILLFLSFLCVIVSIPPVLLHPGKFIQKIIIFTNYNFMALSLCTFIALRKLIYSNRFILLKVLLVVSLAINLVAFGQWLFPRAGYNIVLLQLYGGAPSEIARSLGYASFAEFLIYGAHRYTSIFNGMHVLAMFDLIIIAISFAVIHERKMSTNMKWIGWLVLSTAAAGGVLTNSRTFYLGLAAIVCSFVIVRRKLSIFVMSGMLVILLVIMMYLFQVTERVESMLFGGNILESRYGSAGYLAQTIETIKGDPWVLLFGAGSAIAEYKLADSLYISVICVGGLVFLISYLAPFIWLLIGNIRQINLGNPWALCFMAIHLAFVCVGIGIPTYQVGRIVPLLIILNLSFIVPFEGKEPSFEGRIPYSIC
jgi:hypothetical protein